MGRAFKNHQLVGKNAGIRSQFFAGQERKMIPLLLGLVLLSVFAIVQDIDSGALTSPLVGYMIF